MYSKYLHLLLLLLTQAALAQKTVPFFGKIHWLSGYAREVSGESITYFSAYPDYATVALLTRCTDGQKSIEWETTPVPQEVKGKYIYFSWVAAHSSGTSKGDRPFDLYVNGEKLLTFTTQPAHRQPNWTFAAADSSRLVFEQTKRDGANDAHGLAYLRLPISRVTPGQPLRLRVVGQAQSSPDWYMTFKFAFEENVDVAPMPFLLRDGSQPVLLTALHFGKPQNFEVQVDGRPSFAFAVQEGINTFDIPLPAVQKEDSTHLRILVGKRVLLNRYVRQQPVVHRDLHFLHHAHTDIGYSHLQPDVVRIHNQNIRDALRMIEATRTLPPEARFKWNVESLWAVENFLNEATPQEEAAFVEAVREGGIGLSALYANLLTGMSQPEEMFHYTDYARRLQKAYGFDLRSAMMSDVPGATWTTVTALGQAGVRYFSSGPNYLGPNHPYEGDRVGHFVKTWGDKPVWWASPSGEEKVLFWTAGRGYSSWHGLAAGAIFERGPKKIAAYLNDLDARHYPYDLVQWRYNIVADNGPIDTSISRFVQAWNLKYASPRIVLNTTERLFEAFEKKYGDALPTVQGDISPYWEDGALSTAREEGQNRINALRLQQLSTLYAMLRPAAYAPDSFYEAWRHILLFHEHTWGAHNSISQPDLPFVQEQWRIKHQYLLDGEAKITALEDRLLAPIRRATSSTVAVCNTASWKRSGPVFVPDIGEARSVKSPSGHLQPLQKLTDGRGVFLAHDVPPLGSLHYTLSPEAAPPAAPFSLGKNEMSNGHLRIAWDSLTGSVMQLRRVQDFNFAGTFRQQGLNSYWYVPGLDPATAQTNGRVQVRIREQGPVMMQVAVRSEAPGCTGLERTLTLFAEGDVLHLENTTDKQAVREKEGLYFGFPFESTLQQATLDAGYGCLHYPADQLPGSNLDYLCGRRWLDLSAPDQGVQWLLLESPLVTPGHLIDERLSLHGSHKAWRTDAAPTAVWFSYAMNNYWHTNYKADQEGLARFRYALRPHGLFNHSETERAAAEYTQPLVALRLREDVLPLSSLFELSSPHVVVTVVQPQETGGWLLRLFNPEPSVQSTFIRGAGGKSLHLTLSASGSPLPTDQVLRLGPMQVLTVWAKLP